MTFFSESLDPLLGILEKIELPPPLDFQQVCINGTRCFILGFKVILAFVLQ
jgi:hypothetical protein